MSLSAFENLNNKITLKSVTRVLEMIHRPCFELFHKDRTIFFGYHWAEEECIYQQTRDGYLGKRPLRSSLLPEILRSTEIWSFI